MQARGKRLLKAHKVTPGPELAAVRMAGQLQVKARVGRRGCTARLVCQQQFEECLLRRVGHRRVRVAAVAFIEMMGAVINDLVLGKKELNAAIYRIVLPDGQTRYIESHAIIKKSAEGKPVCLIGTNRDVTGAVLVQEKIKAQNKALREIAFIQSHEIRRPLANILGTIELLKTIGTVNELEVFHHLEESARELDHEIRNIVNKTNSLDDETFR